MIEAKLQSLFEKIFDFKKTTFNAPSDSQEQECLFIEIDTVRTNVKDNTVESKVTGKASVYAPSDKLPVMYLAQKIRAANPSLTKDLFFYDFEQNFPMEVNIVKRGFGFVYLFSGQYDPHNDNIESIDIEGLDS